MQLGLSLPIRLASQPYRKVGNGSPYEGHQDRVGNALQKSWEGKGEGIKEHHPPLLPVHRQPLHLHTCNCSNTQRCSIKEHHPPLCQVHRQCFALRKRPCCRTNRIAGKLQQLPCSNHIKVIAVTDDCFSMQLLSWYVHRQVCRELQVGAAECTCCNLAAV